MAPTDKRTAANQLPSADATHVDNAAISLSYGDLEPRVSSPGPIDKEPAPAVYAAHVSETSIAKQPLTLAASYPSAAVEVGADPDVDGDAGLGAGLHRGGYWGSQQGDRKPHRQ